MRTTLSSRAGSWRRVMAGLAVTAVSVGLVAATGATAEAYAPPGSPLEVFVSTDGNSSLSAAVQNGWWGHEGGSGGTGTGTSYLDLDASDLTALDNLFGLADLGNIRVAFVPSSADGSAEHPTVTVGETIDQAYPYFMDAGFGTAFSGSSAANDSVAVVSTGSEFDAWWAAGQPVQGFDSSLVSHDVTAPGEPVSAAPRGKSILNRWPSGTHLSMVFVQTTGAINAGGKPILKVGSDGHAITSYMKFTTAAKPGDAIRTSAGYVDENFGVQGVATSTTLAASPASPQTAGTPITLTATVSPNTGSATPTGSVEFFDGVTSLGNANVDGSGHATLGGQVLATGAHTLKAVFSPTGAFESSTSANVPFQIDASPATPTTTSVAAVPGADYLAPVALSATVTPAGAAGTVQFKEGAANLGSPVTVDALGNASLSYTFSAPGPHSVTAVFTPADSALFSGSQATPVPFTLGAGSVSVDQQVITGVVPEGTLTITTPYDAANPLNLGTLALSSDLSHYAASADFEHIHVMDLRSGALPWTATAQAGDLTDGASHYINGQNVGLTNLLAYPTSNAGLGTITTVDNPAALPAVAPGDTGTLGLGNAPHPILSSNHGPSDVEYHGTMTLNAPTTTPAGTYTGTVTFTFA